LKESYETINIKGNREFISDPTNVAVIQYIFHRDSWGNYKVTLKVKQYNIKVVN
jgi:hypothetical protein